MGRHFFLLRKRHLVDYVTEKNSVKKKRNSVTAHQTPQATSTVLLFWGALRSRIRRTGLNSVTFGWFGRRGVIGGGPWTTTGSTVFPFSFWRTTGRTSGSRVSFVLSTPKKKNRLIGCRRRTAKPPPKKTAGTARPGTHTAKKGHVRSSHNCVIFPWSTKKKEEEEKFEIKSKDNDPYPPLPNRFRGKFDEKSINSVW